MTGFDEGLVEQARVEAAHMEWERWKRANGVAAAGLRHNAADMRKLAVRLPGFYEGELLRMAAMAEALAEQLDGENWLKSPKAMALMRQQEAKAG